MFLNHADSRRIAGVRRDGRGVFARAVRVRAVRLGGNIPEQQASFTVTIEASVQAGPVVTGKIDFRQEPDAGKISRIVVSIRNTALADGPASLIGTVELKGPFKLPVTFAVPYDPARVKPNPMFYSISARAYTVVDGREKLYYINDTRHNIFRRAGDTHRDVNVKKLR